jgi:S1-C subfamily serine protease
MQVVGKQVVAYCELLNLVVEMRKSAAAGRKKRNGNLAYQGGRVKRIGLAILLGIVIVAIVAVGYNGWFAASPPAQVVAPTPTLGPFEPANALEAQVVQTYEQTRGSVVNITSRTYTTDYFLQPVPQQGTGSGFFYDADGHIVTNFHVVENAEALLVTLADGRNFPAELVGEDPSTDLAVVRIEAEELPQPLVAGTGGTLRPGAFVIAIGNPFGLEGTLTVGVVSALGRIIESPNGRFIGEAIQTDAAINPGNSGGPLLDLEGRLLGVNSQIISASGSSSGIGFAVPVGTVQRVVSQLIAEGRYAHPWLGVQTLDIAPTQAQFLRDNGLDIPVDQGVLVVGVVEGGPAAAAGIQGGDRTVQVGNALVPVGGDVITAVNDTPTPSSQALTVYLEGKTQVGDTVNVSLVRDGESQVVAVTLAERPQ